ncbi:acyl transferase/acyl hydrolase/lysophospholipase [Bisporella sp. PMI_857]|nr:acyl transferase/acyl hydrolase/lysophospholipase [Bisporella sp. PMI_857]
MQNTLLFPFLQPARNISAIIVNDNSADTSSRFPNGSEILPAYEQSFNPNLRPTFFGCNDRSKITIIYIPNKSYSFKSNVSTKKVIYKHAETESMISNGAQIVSQGGRDCWGTCLGCAFMSTANNKLSVACQACFESIAIFEHLSDIC